VTPRWGGAAAGTATMALLGQAWAVRRRVPRLPDAMGPREGVVGTGPAVQVEVIGESSVSGVGIERFEDSLVPALARALAQRSGRRVVWRAHGWSGARVHGVCERLVPRVALDTDLLVVIVGVNDVLRLTSVQAWEDGVARVLSCAADRLGPIPVAWVGLPPLGHLRALPQPLRAIAGARAAALERRTSRAVRRSPTGWLIPTPPRDLGGLGADGFHPDAAGYRAWGEHIAHAAVRHLTAIRPPDHTVTTATAGVHMGSTDRTPSLPSVPPARGQPSATTVAPQEIPCHCPPSPSSATPAPARPLPVPTRDERLAPAP
jgi:lysophospholipase L1-like esterase